MMRASPKLNLSHVELQVSADGTLSCRSAVAALLYALDRRFRDAALHLGAEEHSFPTLIFSESLSRAGYFEAFPGGATRVDGASLVPTRTGAGSYCLSPAACYHCYELLADSTLDRPTVFTCAGRCFRGDPPDGSHLWEFTMREVVFLGSAAFVHEQRESWRQSAAHWADQLDLEAVSEAASDPFFGAANRGKKLLQQLQALKYELRAPCLSNGSAAIASFNLHEQFLTEAFRIGFRDEGLAFSGCAAFGLERWAMALLARYPAAEALARVESLT